MCTRNYRPPEAILVEKDYDTAIDIWQFGAILGETMRVSRPYTKRTADPSPLFSDRVMFTGDSSYPLSPMPGFGDCQVSAED